MKENLDTAALRMPMPYCEIFLLQVTAEPQPRLQWEEVGWRKKRGAHSRVGQLVGYLDPRCSRPQANPKHNWGALSPLVSFSRAGGGDPADFLMSFGTVLPGCMSSAISHVWLAGSLTLGNGAGEAWSELLRSSAGLAPWGCRGSFHGLAPKPCPGCSFYFSWIY